MPIIKGKTDFPFSLKQLQFYDQSLKATLVSKASFSLRRTEKSGLQLTRAAWVNAVLNRTNVNSDLGTVQ